jgi:hypothetical protein
MRHGQLQRQFFGNWFVANEWRLPQAGHSKVALARIPAHFTVSCTVSPVVA